MEKKIVKIPAYTVNSSDDEYRSSDKGTYADYATASKKAEHAGWYGSPGTVKDIDVWRDENGNLYKLEFLGKGFTDEIEQRKKDTLESIKSKLTEEELKFLKINKLE